MILVDMSGDAVPQAGQVASIAACQTWAMPLEGYGVHYFVFDGITEECMLYSTLQVKNSTQKLIKLKTHCLPKQRSYYHSCISQPSRLTAASLEDQGTPLPLQNVRKLLLLTANRI